MSALGVSCGGDEGDDFLVEEMIGLFDAVDKCCEEEPMSSILVRCVFGNLDIDGVWAVVGSGADVRECVGNIQGVNKNGVVAGNAVSLCESYYEEVVIGFSHGGVGLGVGAGRLAVAMDS